MFDAIRSNQRILQFILLVLILPAFVFFGVSGYTRNSTKDDAVATIGDQKVTRQEYDRAVSNQVQQMRQMFGGQMEASMLDTPELRKNVLDGLSSQKVLLADAASQKMVGSLDQVEKVIRTYPNLSKPDGSIDIQRLKELLGAQGMSLEMFQSQLQRDIGAQLKPESVANTSFLPQAVIERLLVLSEEVRDIKELKLSAKDLEAKITPTPEQLKAYYDKNAKNFQIPESAKVEYVVFSAESMANTVQLNADDVKTYYEQNKESKYKQKEERQASHILIKTDGGKDAAKAKAQGLLDQVKKEPGKFAELAKANSQDPGSAVAGGDLGFFERESMVKPFADAAFSLKQGDTSELVESEFGYHIIRVTGIRGGAVKPFDEVKGELEAELKKQQASKKFAEGATQFTDSVYEQADTFKGVADKLKIAVQSLENLPRAGLPKPAAGAPAGNGAAAVFSNPKVLAALFSEDSVKRKRNIEAVEVAPNTMASARILEHTPAKQKPLETVTAEVTTAVKQEQARELAKTQGQERLKALQAKASDEGFGAQESVTRAVQSNKFAAPALQAIFKAPREKLPAFVGVELPGDGYAIYQVLAVKASSGDEAIKRTAQVRDQLAKGVNGLDVTSYMNGVKARIPVELKIDPKTEAKPEAKADAKADGKKAADKK